MPIWRKEHELARVIVHYVGVLGTVACIMALIGQLTSRPALYSWGHFGAMSLPTAVVCTAYGIAVYLVSRGEATHAGSKECD